MLVTGFIIRATFPIRFFFTCIQHLTPYHFAEPEELKARSESFWLFQKAEPHTDTTVEAVDSEQSRLEVVAFIHFLVADTGLGDFPE